MEKCLNKAREFGLLGAVNCGKYMGETNGKIRVFLLTFCF